MKRSDARLHNSRQVTFFSAPCRGHVVQYNSDGNAEIGVQARCRQLNLCSLNAIARSYQVREHSWRVRLSCACFQLGVLAKCVQPMLYIAKILLVLAQGDMPCP
jgi:hypothetical protein